MIDFKILEKNGRLKHVGDPNCVGPNSVAHWI